MSRINTNVSSLISQINLHRSQGDLQVALNRLSTGLRINSGKDDPAGLIASEEIGSDIVAINKAVSNTQQANQVIATAESALGQISKLLNDIRGLVTEAANTGALSSDQIAADQLQVDASLEAIDRISSITSFQGKKLLDGSLNFVTSGVSSAALASVQIEQATIPTTGPLAVSLTLTTAATQAQIDTTVALPLVAQAVVEVSGSQGSEVFTFGAGTTQAQIVSAINLVSSATGVAAAVNGANVRLSTSGYGSDEFVAVNVISGTFTTSAARATGTNAVGNINGVAWNAKGNHVSINTATLDLAADLISSFAPATTNFSITGGGALFQLGPDIVANQQSRIGVESVNVAKLGGTVNGSLRRMYELRSGQAADLDSDPTAAFQIIDAVINKVASLRGRLGAFQRTALDTNIASLNDTLSNLTEAQSNIRDADFAVETARLTRAQILVQSGTSVLQISNQSPQNVLALLPRG